MSLKLPVADITITNNNNKSQDSNDSRRPSILKNGAKSALVGRSPLDITIEDLKSDKNPDGINMTAEQLEVAKADYLREQSLFASEKGEEDQDDWNRLQFLEYTTRGLAPAKDFTIDESLDGPEAYRKFQIDHDDVISTAGIDSSRFQKELLSVENTKKVQSLKDELNSSTNEALQELEAIYEHVAKITSKLYSHEIDQNDVLNDAILDKLVLESQPDQRSSSRNSQHPSLMSKKGGRVSINNSNLPNSGNNLVLQATKTPKGRICFFPAEPSK